MFKRDHRIQPAKGGQPAAMKISRRAVLGILLTGLFMIVGVLLRSAILENFVKPIALLLWTVNRLLASVDQIVYWIGLILIGMFITFLRAAFHTLQPIDQRTIHYGGKNATLRTVDQWRIMILLTLDETDQPNHLRRNLMNLLKDVYASKQPHLVPWEVYQTLERGDIPLPEQVKAFFFQNQSQAARPSLFDRLQQLSKVPGKWVRHWKGQDVADYYASIEEVITFMEQQLEHEDDR